MANNKNDQDQVRSLLELVGIPFNDRGPLIKNSWRDYQSLSAAELAQGINDTLPLLCFVPLLDGTLSQNGFLGMYYLGGNKAIAASYSGLNYWSRVIPLVCSKEEFFRAPLKFASEGNGRFRKLNQLAYRNFLREKFPEISPDISGEDALAEFAKSSLFCRFKKNEYGDYLKIHTALAEKVRATGNDLFLGVVSIAEDPQTWVAIARWMGQHRKDLCVLHVIETAFRIRFFEIWGELTEDRKTGLQKHVDWVDEIGSELMDPAHLPLLENYKRAIRYRISWIEENWKI